jgi:hypothetical protein
MDAKSNGLFWNASIDEIVKGYTENDQEYSCIICEESFQKGRIYELNSKLYDAKMAVVLHIQEKHGSMLEYLLGMNSSFTGLTETQRMILSLMAEGLTDKEIALRLGVAQSTIRNHRYKLREKERQAKLFLSIMSLLSENTNRQINKLDKELICDAHKTATSVDDRYNITDKEKQNVIKNYFTPEGALKTYPSKEKRKIIVLEEITRNFKREKIYSEKEVNRILSRIFEDYVAIRRALIEYGFLERTDDCSKYWVKE